jgi:hypothetical protein
VRDNLVLVVTDCRLGDRTDIASSCAQHIRVIGREDGGSSADDRAERIVELLRLGLVDGSLQRRALSRCCGGDAGDGGVLVEVVVVVGCCAYNRALRFLVCRSRTGGGGAGDYILFGHRH